MRIRSIMTAALMGLGLAGLAWPAQGAGGSGFAARISLEPIRAAYSEGRFQEAVVLVDRAFAEGSVPAEISGELHFWRGASLRRLNRHEEALVALDTARREGFRPSELALERALVLKSLGRGQEAEREYRDLDRRLEGDPERRLRFGEEWRRAHEKEPDFRLTITPRVGYDSNPIGIDKDAPLGEDLDRDSFYAGAVLLARYYLAKSEERVFFLEARSEERLYSSEPDLGYTDNALSAVGRLPLTETLGLEGRGSLGEAWVRAPGHARTIRSAGSALVWRPDSTWQIRLLGDWAGTSYYEGDIPAEQDRDGTLQRGGMSVGIDLGKGWSVGPMATYGRYDADGDDFDCRELAAGLGITTGEMLGCVVSLAFSHARAEYDHPNSLTGFTEKRRDRINTITVVVTARRLEGWIGYAPSVVVSFMDHGSNVDAYDYERWEPRLELGIAALTF